MSNKVKLAASQKATEVMSAFDTAASRTGDVVAVDFVQKKASNE